MFAHSVARFQRHDFVVREFQIEGSYGIGQVIFLGDTDDGRVDDGVAQDPGQGDTTSGCTEPDSSTSATPSSEYFT